MVLSFDLDTSEFEKAMKDKMIQVGEDIFVESQNNIVSKGIVDQGFLLNSGKLNIGDDFVEVKYSALYAEDIEFGRPEGSFPPVSKIQEWVERKGVKFTDKKGKVLTSKQMAFIIGKSIKENGTEPRPFLTPAITNVRNKLKNG